MFLHSTLAARNRGWGGVGWGLRDSVRGRHRRRLLRGQPPRCREIIPAPNVPPAPAALVRGAHAAAAAVVAAAAPARSALFRGPPAGAKLQAESRRCMAGVVGGDGRSRANHRLGYSRCSCRRRCRRPRRRRCLRRRHLCRRFVLAIVAIVALRRELTTAAGAGGFAALR